MTCDPGTVHIHIHVCIHDHIHTAAHIVTHVCTAKHTEQSLCTGALQAGLSLVIVILFGRHSQVAQLTAIVDIV